MQVVRQVFGGDSKTSGKVTKMTKGIETGIIIGCEAFRCIVDLGELYKKRKEVPQDGKLGYTRKEFVEDCVERISSVIFSTVVSGAVTMTVMMVPGLGPVAGFVKKILCGSPGTETSGSAIKWVGPQIAKAITSFIANDRPVSLDQLNPGDHIVVYGNVLHPRCHCVVLNTVEETGEIVVIRYKNGSGVVYEELSYDEKNPPLKMMYPANTEIFSPEEIVDRAMDALEAYDKRYNLLTNNCKHFAYSVIMKPK